MAKISGTELAKKYKGYYHICTIDPGLEHFFDARTMEGFAIAQNAVLSGLYKATAGIRNVKKMLDASLDLVTAKDEVDINRKEEIIAVELVEIAKIIEKYMYHQKPEDIKKIVPEIQGDQIVVSKVTMKDIEFTAISGKDKDGVTDFIVKTYKPTGKVIDFSAEPRITPGDVLKLSKMYYKLEQEVTKYATDATKEIKTIEGLLEVTIDKLNKGLDTIISDYKSRADDNKYKAFRRRQIKSIRETINVISNVVGKFYLKTLLNIGVMSNDIVNSGIVDIAEKALSAVENKK